jgi:hypothetical protein
MRFLLALIGLAALVVAILLSMGWMTLSTQPGQLPSLHVEGGKAPEVKANMATISVGTENKTIAVPTLHVNQPDNAAAPQ